MELLSPGRNLQKASALAVEELYPELHGWGGAMELNGGLPMEGIVMLIPVIDGVPQPDSIGLSAAALWAALPTTHRSIYLVDENTLRSDETIITNIEASEYLSDGGTLVGTEANGYAQYADGTSEDVLRKAYRYFGVFYPAYLYFGTDQVLFGTDGVSL